MIVWNGNVRRAFSLVSPRRTLRFYGVVFGSWAIGITIRGALEAEAKR